MGTTRMPSEIDGAVTLFDLLVRAHRFLPTSPSAAPAPTTTRDAAATAPHGNWLDRLDHWFWQRRQHALEAYLAQSHDVFELEARIRGIERRSPHPYY